MKFFLGLFLIIKLSLFGSIFTHYGYINVQTWSGLSLYVDNKYKGVTGENLTKIKLSSGNHEIKVHAYSQDGNWFYLYKKEIYIGENMEITITLTPIKYPTKKKQKEDEKINIYYNEHIKDFQKTKKLFRARHILVRTKEEAEIIIKTINKSKNKKQKFIELANKQSIGPSGKKGGELGWFKPQAMVPKFDKKLHQLKVGTYTKRPVKTQFGYHVIYLENNQQVIQLTIEEARHKIKEILGFI